LLIVAGDDNTHTDVSYSMTTYGETVMDATGARYTVAVKDALLGQLLGADTLVPCADGTFSALAAGVRHSALYHISSFTVVTGVEDIPMAGAVVLDAAVAAPAVMLDVASTDASRAVVAAAVDVAADVVAVDGTVAVADAGILGGDNGRIAGVLAVLPATTLLVCLQQLLRQLGPPSQLSQVH